MKKYGYEFKLIILDIDGTLLDSTGHYTPWTYPAIPKLFPGAVEVLDKLYFESELMLGVATSMCRHSLDLTVARFFTNAVGSVESPFVITKSAEETAPKPDPKMLLEILDEIEYNGRKLSPIECLVVGDSDTDMIMADRAGMFGLSVATGVPGKKAEAAKTTLSMLSSIADLPEWLEENMR